MPSTGEKPLVQANGIGRRKLGNSGLTVAPLIFGGNVFGWTVSEAEGCRLLDHFVASGFNMVDTADVYSNWIPGNRGGESETLIGRWLKQSGKRGQILIATKLGLDMGGGRKGLSKKYILEEIEESLRRLQTDYIDLYQFAHPGCGNAPRRNPRGLRSAHPIREGSRDRRLELLCRDPAGGA